MFLDVLYNIVISPLEIIFDAIFFALRSNPGIAIIAISLVMNFLALPLYQRADAIQEEERNKAASMKHWVDHIKKTFKGDERYMMLNEYYRIEGYKPIYALRSMFPLLLQIPFFIAAYHYLSNQPALGGVSFLFLENLGAPDQLLTIGGLTVNVMPIVMTLINVVSAYIYLRGFPLKDKIQTYGIAAIFLVLLYNSPSGLVFYWTMNQVFSVGKNIFMKLVKRKDIRYWFFGVLGILIVIILKILGFVQGTDQITVAIVFLIASFVPLIAYYAKERFPTKPKSVKPIKVRYFVLGTVFISMFLGLVIPLAAMYSDPGEFASRMTSPLELLLHNTSVFAGFFCFWLGIYYYLSETKLRNMFTIVIWLLSGTFAINYFLFPGHYGILYNYFVFDESPIIINSDMIINGIVLVAVLLLLFFILKKWEKAVGYVYTILIISCVALSGFYGVSTGLAINKIENIAASPEQQAAKREKSVYNLTLSKKGKNVIVMMIDRAESLYFPFILDEKPELKQQFSGFTYYPNTLSYGICTKWGAPALYGGYDYTPEEMNKRSGELMVDKHDEALTVMPALFSANDYKTTIWGVPLAGYEDPERAAKLFDFDKRIKQYSISGHYFDRYYHRYGKALEESKKNNLVFYSLFRVFPVCLRSGLYNNGDYYQTWRTLYSEDFLREFAALNAMPNAMKIEDNAENHFMLMYNELPHEPAFVQKPNYIPEDHPGERFDRQSRRINGVTLQMDNQFSINTYGVNVSAYHQIAKWLDYLKQEGVYDNTRIIIVSDHGARLGGQIKDTVFEDGTDIEALNCMLLVKDFNSKGELKTSDEFMMNADVPTLAFEKIIFNPINPYNGNAITNIGKKDKVIVTHSNAWNWDLTEKVFDYSTGSVAEVRKGNILDKRNWTILQPQH